MAAQGLGLRSRATWAARTAAILPWATAGRGAAGNRPGAGVTPARAPPSSNEIPKPEFAPGGTQAHGR